MDGPVRTCRACGLKAAKNNLHRYVWGDGSPRKDCDQTMVGRGVYCCRRESCVERFMKQKKKWKIYFRL